MNSNTVNFVYSFNNNAVLEYEYKINTRIKKSDRKISSLYPPYYKCFLKHDINNNVRSMFYIKQYGYEGNQPENVQEENDSDTVGSINTKRLGTSWRKQTNMQKRKRQLLRNEKLNNESNSTACLISNQQRLLAPHIPACYQHEHQQQQYYDCNMCKTNFRSIISENETSILHVTNISEKKYVTPIEKGFTQNLFVAADDNNNKKEILCAKREKRWRHHKHRTRIYSNLFDFVRIIMSCSYFLLQNCKTLHFFFVLLLTSTQYLGSIQGLLVSKSLSAIGVYSGSVDYENASDILVYNSSTSARNNSSINKRLTKYSYNLEQEGGDRGETYLSANKNLIFTSSTEGETSGGGYLDKLDNLEKSLAAVLIKVAYGTTSTTKRSIPENSYVPSLTTISTPLLTTLRYQEKSHQSQLNMHLRNYELDLERDHALPTSAPNADILKSNSNPTYPNPNRHHNHERDRHRHLINSTPKPSFPNIMTKTNGHIPTISMFPVSGELPSYSPPARSFFTPPLPPEYQHPFADKPTLRGTNNEGGIEINSGSYINRRPIPPPSLMPGHERIPFRPPDLSGTLSNNEGDTSAFIPSLSGSTASPAFFLTTANIAHHEVDIKKALNTPSKSGFSSKNVSIVEKNTSSSGTYLDAKNNLYNNSNNPEVKNEVLPSIRRILSGSNGRKGDIPEVLLKQVTTRPNNNFHHPPSSPVVLIDPSLLTTNEGSMENIDNKQNINKIKNIVDPDINNDDEKAKIRSKTLVESNFALSNITSTPSAAAAIGGSEKSKPNISAAAATSTSSSNLDLSTSTGKNNGDRSSSSTSSSTSSISSSTSSSTLASASGHATWSLAWNVHVYLSVILFTILAVYSFYKMITYNKLTHIFSQSYFICIHLILIIICIARTFYLCYDAYNIHSSFPIFISEVLLNLPATFLTITFAVLILFLSLKSLNHKNNRYSALIRPLTVVVGCGVHVVLCITLHYVESYTLQNHQQHLHNQQQQQQLLTKRQQMQQQQNHQNIQYNYLQNQYSYAANIVGLETMAFSSSVASVQGANFHQHNIATSVSSLPPAPPRVLSLICQIIYIFVCFSLGLLYLYLYRILKRILRSKSQNYIHGYQNLSYAIHITIATALLFVLLASLQIFGAISISSSRPLITQKTSEIDWLQWGYQFSLRLIEIAIITLISWVTGLKTTNGSNTVNINLTNNEARVVAGQVNIGNSMFNSNLSVNPVREKNNPHSNQYNQPNMTNFFLPCTSSSSQEQFDTDYPAVCNANSNLHTYTMRTGKLIYDDSFALNSLNGSNSAAPASDFIHPHHQVQLLTKQQPPQSTYQHPYDSQSLHSSAHHNVSEYGTRINYQPENHLQFNDYLTDNTTDHYENPNFDLRGSGSATSGSALVVNSNAGNGTMQKFGKTSISNSTTTPSSSNNSNMGSNSSSGSSATLQQQMLLLHGGGETCYSEPIHENYDFNNFEKPKFKQQPHDNWPEAHIPTIINKRDKKKSLTTLERCGYDKPERRSSNSTHSCNSNSNSVSNGVGGNNNGSCSGSSRYASFNAFERAPFNNIRKSDTFNSTAASGANIMHGRNHSSSSATSTTSASGPGNNSLCIQTLASTERHHHAMPPQNLRVSGSSKVLANNSSGLDVFSRSTIERLSINHSHRPPNQPQLNQSQAQHHQYSDDDDDDKDDDIMLAASSHQV